MQLIPYWNSSSDMFSKEFLGIDGYKMESPSLPINTAKVISLWSSSWYRSTWKTFDSVSLSSTFTPWILDHKWFLKLRYAPLIGPWTLILPIFDKFTSLKHDALLDCSIIARIRCLVDSSLFACL